MAQQNNIHLVGFPEKMEGGHMERFVEYFILHTVKPRDLSTQFTVKRAYHTLGSPLKLGGQPRPIKAQILNFRDKIAILRAA